MALFIFVVFVIVVAAILFLGWRIEEDRKLMACGEEKRKSYAEVCFLQLQERGELDENGKLHAVYMPALVALAFAVLFGLAGLTFWSGFCLLGFAAFAFCYAEDLAREIVIRSVDIDYSSIRTA